MPTGYESGEKFLRVIQLFQRLCDTQAGLTTRQLADELEVSSRTVQRYLVTLRDSAGVDVEEVGGRWRIGEVSRLPPMQFDHHQATALLVAVRLLHQMRQEHDPSLVGALAQLSRALRVPAVSRYLESTIAAAEARPQNAARREVERVVVDGFVRGQVVEVEYTDKAGRSSRRVLRPYFLEPRPENRVIYVFALDERSQELRSFRLDRISSARLLPRTFQVPADFDIDRVVRGAWGIWVGDAETEVVLRFSAEVARRVRETPWHPSAELTPLPGGGVEMRLRVASEVEMRPWVLGWGGEVEVVAPAQLREHVAATMRRGAGLYPV
ncbi:MAG: helix-turn-helix transcriptional regulator [Candidatus Dormibacteria bacterium]